MYRHSKILLTAVIIAFLGITFLSPRLSSLPTIQATGATQVVNSLSDAGGGQCPSASNCTLRAAIAAANAGDTITFDSGLYRVQACSTTPYNGCPTIYLTSEIAIGKNITIIGPGKNKGGIYYIAISSTNVGQFHNRAFNISSTAVVEVDNLQITGITYYGNGASIFNSGALTINGSLFNLNTALSGNGTGQGGAIYNDTTSVLAINNTVFRGNTSADLGGAIYNLNNLTINNSVFNGNAAYNGKGAGALYINTPQGTSSSVGNSLFDTNKADAGGAIVITGVGATVANSTFTNNVAVVHGGAAVDNVGSSSTVTSKAQFDFDTFTYNGTRAAAPFKGSLKNDNSLGLARVTLNDTLVVHSNLTALNPQGVDILATNGGDAGDNCSGTITIGTALGNFQYPGTTCGTGISTVDPAFRDVNSSACPNANTQPSQLDPLCYGLKDNGGPAKTVALPLLSPVRKQTSCAVGYSTDQRGAYRRYILQQGVSCDSGAYEYDLAITRTVANTNDSGPGSLRQAVLDSDRGDMITFAFTTPSTITLASPIAINKDLTIIGPVGSAGNYVLTISGNHLTKVFLINPSTGYAWVTLNGLTIANGSASSGNGGAIEVDGINPLTIVNTVFSNNTARSGWGGAIYATGSLRIANTTFSGNTAYHGGAVALAGGYATTRIVRSLFSSNTAISADQSNNGNKGGALYDEGSSLTIINSTFYANSAPIGGAVETDAGTITIHHTTFSGNITIPNTTGGQRIAGAAIDNSLNQLPNNTTLHNSVIANSTGPNCHGPIVDQGGNVQYAGDVPNSCGQSIPINNPNLASAPANNGGLTQTFSITAPSAAIAAATPGYKSDQRSWLRSTTPDTSGAFEYNSPGPTRNGVGLFQPGSINPLGPNQFLLRNALNNGSADITVRPTWVLATDIPIAGDWNGDGIVTIGVYRQSTSEFLLTDSNTPSPASPPLNYDFFFGTPGHNDLPIVGDWTGSGKDGVGLLDPTTGTISLKNVLATGGPDSTIVVGNDIPVAGDWNGDGIVTVGVFRPAVGQFVLTDTSCVSSCFTNVDYNFTFLGAPSPQDLPVIGDWSGNGVSGVGVFRNTLFYLKNQLTQGSVADYTFGIGQESGQPIAGFWNSGASAAVRPHQAMIAPSIAFISNRDGEWGIYRLNGDEQHLQRLATIGSNALDSRPALSPDGKHIVFAATRDGGAQLYVMNVDSSGVHQMTYTKALNYQPSWSPDGKQIVFASNLGNSTNLYLMDANGGNVQQLTHNLSDVSEQPSWSPDGNHIVFAMGKGTLDIAMISIDGKSSTVLTQNGRQPAWSPDGKQIVFASTRDGNSQIYIMNADGSNIRRLTNTKAQEEMPTWSPDGQHIAFVSTRDGNAQIYVMNADGSNVQRLTNNDAQDTLPVWLP